MFQPRDVPAIAQLNNFVVQIDEFRHKHEPPQASVIYTLVINNELMFPFTEIALRIYMITNATGDRSFSRLKHIKMYLCQQ
jgi:hypothetical protein